MEDQQLFSNITNSNKEISNESIERLQEYIESFKRKENDGILLKQYIQRSPKSIEIIEIFKNNPKDSKDFHFSKTIRFLIEMLKLEFEKQNEQNQLDHFKENTINYLFSENSLLVDKYLQEGHLEMRISIIELIITILKLHSKYYRIIMTSVKITGLMWKRMFAMSEKLLTKRFREVMVQLIEVYCEGCIQKSTLKYMNDFLHFANPLFYLVEELMNDSEELQRRVANALLSMIQSPLLYEKQISFFFKRIILYKLYGIFSEPTCIPEIKELIRLLFTVPGYLTPNIPTNKQKHYTTIVEAMLPFEFSHKETRQLLFDIVKKQAPIISQMFLSKRNLISNIGIDLPSYIQSSFFLELFNSIPLPVATLTPSTYDFIRNSIIYIENVYLTKLIYSKNTLFQHQASLILYSMCTRAEIYAKSTNADSVLMGNICSDLPDIQVILLLSQSSPLAQAKCYECFEILHRIAPASLNVQQFYIRNVILKGLESNHKLVLYRTLKLAEELNNDIEWLCERDIASKAKKTVEATIIPIKKRIDEISEVFPLMKEEYNRIIIQKVCEYSRYEQFLYRLSFGEKLSEIIKIGKPSYSQIEKSIDVARTQYMKIPQKYDSFICFHFILMGENITSKQKSEIKALLEYYSILMKTNQINEMSKETKEIIIGMIKSIETKSKEENDLMYKSQLLLCLMRMRHGMEFDEEVKHYFQEEYNKQSIRNEDIIYLLMKEVKKYLKTISFSNYSVEKDMIDSMIRNIIFQLKNTEIIKENESYNQMVYEYIQIITLLKEKKELSKELVELLKQTIEPFFELFKSIDEYYQELVQLYLSLIPSIEYVSQSLLQSLFIISTEMKKKIIQFDNFGSYLTKLPVTPEVSSIFLLLIDQLPFTENQLLDIQRNKTFMKSIKSQLLQENDFSILYNWYWKGLWGKEKEELLQLLYFLFENKKEYIQQLIIHNCSIQRDDTFENICRDILIPANLLGFSVHSIVPLSITMILNRIVTTKNQQQFEIYLNLLLQEALKTKKLVWIERSLEELFIQIQSMKIVINIEIIQQLKEYIPKFTEPIFKQLEKYLSQTYQIENTISIVKNKLFPIILTICEKDHTFIEESIKNIFKEIISLELTNEMTLEYEQLIPLCSYLFEQHDCLELLEKDQWIELIVNTLQSVKYGYSIIPLLYKAVEQKSIQSTILLKISEKTFKPKWIVPIHHTMSILLNKLFENENPTFEIMKTIYEHYSGTTSPTDRLLFVLIRKYSPLYSTLPLIHGRNSFDYKTTINRMYVDGIFFNSKDMEFSNNNYPFSRKWYGEPIEKLMEIKEIKDQYPYDPCYLLPLIYHNINRCIAFKKYIFDPKSYVTNGFLSFVITSLALEDDSLRKIAYSILQKTIYILKDLTFMQFFHRTFIYAFLFVLRNSIQTPNQLLPSSVTILYSKMIMIIVQKVDADWNSIVEYLFKRKTCKIPLNPFNFMERLDQYPQNCTHLFMNTIVQTSLSIPSIPRIYLSKNVYEYLLSNISHPQVSLSECRVLLLSMNKLTKQWGIPDSSIFYLIQLFKGTYVNKLFPLLLELVLNCISHQTFTLSLTNQIPICFIIIELLQQFITSKTFRKPELIENMKIILSELQISSNSLPQSIQQCSLQLQNQLITCCDQFEQFSLDSNKWFY